MIKLLSNLIGVSSSPVLISTQKHSSSKHCVCINFPFLSHFIPSINRLIASQYLSDTIICPTKRGLSSSSLRIAPSATENEKTIRKIIFISGKFRKIVKHCFVSARLARLGLFTIIIVQKRSHMCPRYLKKLANREQRFWAILVEIFHVIYVSYNRHRTDNS